MRKNSIFIILAISLMFTGCTINNDSKLDGEEDNTIIEVESDTSAIITEIKNNNLKNIITIEEEVITIKSNANTRNLDIRNKSISEEYIRGISIVKQFCENNLLEITYVQPISDKISSFNNFPDDEYCVLLKKLESLGAEAVQYFTDEESLNVDLSINMTEACEKVDNEFITYGKTYSDVVYKASIQNINGDFDFKDSKIDEFRNMIVRENTLDYNKVNDYIGKVISKEYKPNTVYLNKIDDDRYEVIRIENNNCYYKLVYDPLF